MGSILESRAISRVETNLEIHKGELSLSRRRGPGVPARLDFRGLSHEAQLLDVFPAN